MIKVIMFLSIFVTYSFSVQCTERITNYGGFGGDDFNPIQIHIVECVDGYWFKMIYNTQTGKIIEIQDNKYLKKNKRKN